MRPPYVSFSLCFALYTGRKKWQTQKLTFITIDIDKANIYIFFILKNQIKVFKLLFPVGVISCHPKSRKELPRVSGVN